jgi:hypothetical protein
MKMSNLLKGDSVEIEEGYSNSSDSSYNLSNNSPDTNDQKQQEEFHRNQKSTFLN